MFRPLPAGVGSWAVAEITRNEADQQAALDAGASQRPWPESAHNYNPSYAVDIWPYDLAGKIISDGSHPAYDFYASIAQLHGMKAPPSWDRGHAEIDGWQESEPLLHRHRTIATASLGAGEWLGLALLAGLMWWQA